MKCEQDCFLSAIFFLKDFIYDDWLLVANSQNHCPNQEKGPQRQSYSNEGLMSDFSATKSYVCLKKHSL